MEYTFQVSRSSKNRNNWRKRPWVILDAVDDKDAWNKFYAFDRGVPDGHWIRCLDFNGNEVPCF